MELGRGWRVRRIRLLWGVTLNLHQSGVMRHLEVARVATTLGNVGSRSSTPPDHAAIPGKHRVPARRVATVSRSGLIERLAASDRPLAVVTAPAGYGKTTLLVELAAVDDRVVVWVSLDATDDDPVALAKDIATGLGARGLAPDSLADEIRGPIVGSGASAVAFLGSALLDAKERFVLVLDDVHLIVHEDGRTLIDGLVDHVPAGSQLVVSGRAAPPFVSRRRVSAEVVEIGAEDLVLDADGVRSVYEAEGLAISPERASQVADRTEGWAAGVYLSVLVSRRKDDDLVSGTLTIKGSNPFLADYLFHHVLDDTYADLQEFLLDAALLDEMHPSLCDHVLEIGTSAQLLRRLEQSNLFAVAIGEERDRYRLHSLFREFLIGERGSRRPPGHDAQILGRAATWCEANDETDRAIEYLLRARDVRRLGPLLTSVLQPAYDDGRATTVERWLREAGGAAVDQHPPLAVLAGWLAAVTARPAQAEELAARLEHLTFDGATEDGWLSFGASRSAFRALVCADGVAAMNHDAELAVQGAPAWSPWRSTAVWLLGQARELAGDRDAAAQLYDDAVCADLDAGRPPLLVPIVGRALLAIDGSDWETAADRVELALHRAEVIVPSNYLEGAMAHAAAARLALHHHDHQRAEQHLEVAMASRGLGTYVVPHTAVRLRTSMATAYATTGDRSTAASLLGEIDSIVARRPDLGALIDEVARVRRLLAPELAGVTALTPAELRVLGYLPTHLTFAEIGEKIFISRHTVHTHAGSIYRKFGVTSRGEAVERARDLGLS